MQVNAREALRYLGADETLLPQVQAMLVRLTAEIRPVWRWRVMDISALALPGESARRMLCECRQMVILAATLGARFDAMLRAQQARDMAQAVIMDACASAYIEAACDEGEKEIAARFPGLYLTDRFSPGYGDLPLSVQPDLLAPLDAQRALGIHVTDHFLLNPSKTVTAVIGLADRPQAARIRGCAYCKLQKHCPYQGGKRCAL